MLKYIFLDKKKHIYSTKDRMKQKILTIELIKRIVRKQMEKEIEWKLRMKADQNISAFHEKWHWERLKNKTH